jgi:hypothetical protein
MKRFSKRNRIGNNGQVISLFGVNKEGYHHYNSYNGDFLDLIKYKKITNDDIAHHISYGVQMFNKGVSPAVYGLE